MKSLPKLVSRRTTISMLLPAILGGCAGVSTEEVFTDTVRVFGAGRDLLTKPASILDLPQKLNSLEIIIGTIEKYQRLSAQQKSRVERIAQQRYDRLVATKKAKLAPTYKAKKSAIAIKELPPEKKEKELAKVDQQWFAAARADAKKEYGSGFAVPVRNSSGKEVVAFARIDGGKAVAASDSYVLAKAPTTGAQVAYSGGKYTVLSESIR